MPNEHILLIFSKTESIQLLERIALDPEGYQVTTVTTWQAAEETMESISPDLIILTDIIDNQDYSEFVNTLFEQNPLIPVILLPDSHSDSLAVNAFRQGITDYLQPPVQVKDIRLAVRRALERRQRWEKYLSLGVTEETKSLNQEIDYMGAIQDIGRKVTCLLDLDSILTAVVDAAVELTNAEEGSLLLIDESTGELFMQASRNFQEEFVNTFRLPIRDTLAGQVLRTGKPLLIDEKTQKKIKTAYLVYTLIYVPLIFQDRVIGVLKVDNRQSRKPFSNEHLIIVSALADYAAIAIENARLYTRSELERKKLETILTGIGEGVIVVDQDRRLVMINQKACQDFECNGNNLIGKRLREVIHHQELLEVLGNKTQPYPSRVELTIKDGRILNALFTSIPDIGLAITMQEITHLKELDRIKSDFVNTVSHDLRSPLTTILGYVELIERVGSVNDQQKEFISRVQASVHHITALINDLLELGRIEAGFDIRKEIVPFSAIITYAVDGMKSRASEKTQKLVLDMPANLPDVLGTPVRLRQMVSSLIANAIKYTPEGGEISVSAHAEAEQLIIQISDNGPGIPPADQPFIFDKFYRASNVPIDSPGTGLGLTIVKSIIENHLGRIWVESSLGQGTNFTVVLPVTDSGL